VWAEDEARLGLEPIARRVWSLKGHRPASNGRAKFESLYVFGFTHPATGRTRTLIPSKANTGTMGTALADFARWADPDGRKVLVIADNAGWHVAGKLAVPPNVVLHHLPSCTPELQPAEPLWPLVRESMANKTFPTLAALEEPLGRRCRWRADHPATVKGRSGSTGPSHSDDYGSARFGITTHRAARDRAESGRRGPSAPPPVWERTPRGRVSPSSRGRYTTTRRRSLLRFARPVFEVR
jgi:transposase